MSFLGLTYSPKKLHYVYFIKRGRELILAKVGISSLEDDFSNPAGLTNTILNILSREKISPSKIFVTIFREDVITHQITLPKMSHEEINEVILGEVEKIPAFSEREFDFTYAKYFLDENRIRVIFTAVFQDILTFLIQGVTGTKFPIERLEIAPLNLLPLFYPLVQKEEEALLVLYDRVSYVIIATRKECNFFYLTNTGKSDLYHSENNQLDNLSFMHWVGELNRIFKSYRIEYKKLDIQRLWFLWDNEGAEDLDKLLSEELKKEVKRIDFESIPYCKKAFSFEDEVNPISLLTSAPIISYVKNLKSEFSFERFLLRIKTKRVLKQAVFISLIFMLCVGVTAGSFTLGYLDKEKQISKELKKITPRITYLEKETQNLRNERNRFLDIREKLLRQAFFVRKLTRVAWSRVFGEIAAELPPELSLTLFKISEMGEVLFEGEAFKIDSVAKMMRKVDASRILQDAKFDFLREKKVQDKRIFTFAIKAHLKREVYGEK